MSKHTLSVLVENKPGVLARIAGLFSRRNFNIDSLAVGPTEHEEISRMTIVVNCDEHPLEQVTKQLNKLVNVLKIVELEPGAAVQRELILIKVRADAETRSKVLETVELFRARVVDVALDAVTVEATGSTDKLQALVRVLEPFGIKELVQSGMVAVGRGGRSITDRALRPLEKTALYETAGHGVRGIPGLTGSRHDTSERPFQWLKSSTTTPPTYPLSSGGTSRCSVTEARGTRTPCRCATPESTCGWDCRKGRQAARRRRTTACACSPPRRHARKPTSRWC